jgi:hypothetical protein
MKKWQQPVLETPYTFNIIQTPNKVQNSVLEDKVSPGLQELTIMFS